MTRFQLGGHLYEKGPYKLTQVYTCALHRICSVMVISQSFVHKVINALAVSGEVCLAFYKTFPVIVSYVKNV